MNELEQVKAKQHTPLPWVLNDGLIRPQDMADRLIESAGTEREWISVGIEDSEGYAACVAYCHPDNGSFIIKACNNYESVLAERDALKEALRQGLESLNVAFDAEENPFGVDRNSAADAICLAEHLLAKAQKKD